MENEDIPNLEDALSSLAEEVLEAESRLMIGFLTTPLAQGPGEFNSQII